MRSLTTNSLKCTARCLIFVVMVYISLVSVVAGQNSKKLDLLRERIRRLEGRLSEDISLIREEFYEELNIFSKTEIHTPANNNVSINAQTISELESLMTNFEKWKNYSVDEIEMLRKGSHQEKRVRRDIQRDICEIKAEKTNVVASVERISENLASGIKDAVEKVSVTEKLNEIIEVLETVSDLLNTNVQRDALSKSETEERVRDCTDWLKQGYKTSGEYTVFPETIWRPIKVYCDMETSGGGWTVFQRRKDGSENFNRKWIDYAFGFGNLSGEFWLGNEYIHRLTAHVPQEMLIEMEDFENDYRYASYGLFSIDSANDFFKLNANFFTGNVTDNLVPGHSGHGFSTIDHGSSSSCAKSYKGGWWYTNCHSVNLNGLYLKGEHKSYADGVNWHGWHGYHYSLKKTEMKFRPH